MWVEEIMDYRGIFPMQSILDFISRIDPINLITALATVFAAIAAFFSARAAYHSVNAQILAAQIALYDRMLSVFNGVSRFIESVVVGDDSTSEDGEKFRREARYMFQKSISESRFIFDEAIQDYIHEISSKEVKLRQAIRRSNKRSNNNEERKNTSRRETGYLNGLLNNN
jgi:hypothetical protein